MASLSIDEKELNILISERQRLAARVDELLAKLSDAENVRRDLKEFINQQAAEITVWRMRTVGLEKECEQLTKAMNAVGEAAIQCRMLDQVAEFHHKFDVPARGSPGWPGWSQAWLRQRLIDEEVNELHDAIANGDIVEVADALGDILYVTLGACLVFGIDPVAVVNEIHRSNMTKDGSLDAGGKITKGPSYEPPNLSKVLFEREAK